MDGCVTCKYFKNYFCTVSNIIELHCKKGNKIFLANGPFACGQDKLDKKSKQVISH